MGHINVNSIGKSIYVHTNHEGDIHSQYVNSYSS